MSSLLRFERNSIRCSARIRTVNLCPASQFVCLVSAAGFFGSHVTTGFDISRARAVSVRIAAAATTAAFTNGAKVCALSSIFECTGMVLLVDGQYFQTIEVMNASREPILGKLTSDTELSCGQCNALIAKFTRNCRQAPGADQFARRAGHS